MRTSVIALVFSSDALLAGCAAGGRARPAKPAGYQTATPDPMRDTELARAEQRGRSA